MLARSYRFHGYGSLRYVYTKGRAIRCPYGVLKYAPNPKRKTWRAAVVVSKKVHKSAVVRNRIRRRVYEIIRTSVPKEAPPVDLVFSIYSAQVAEMPIEELRTVIQSQLQKAGITPQAHAIVDKKE